MSGNKAKGSDHRRELNQYSVESGVSDSGYTTQLDMELSRSQGKPVVIPIAPSTSAAGTPAKSPAVTIPSGGAATGTHDVYNLPQSTPSLPQSAYLSPPQSSPFSPLLTKSESHHISEFNSGTVIAGMAPLDDTILTLDHHSEDLYKGDPQFEEQGMSLPSEMSLPTTGTSRATHGDMKCATATTRLETAGAEKAKRICGVVSEYYQKRFVHHWREKTSGSSQGSKTMSVIAALLIERGEDFNVVVLTAGTKVKTECTFVEGNVRESTWGLCDGHAEAVCYRLASIYLLTEIYKTHKRRESIFDLIDGKGYKLKNGIEFHLFTSHPPCGFMAKKERYYLSWKRPFKTIPHNPQCSSKILINSYLGIQGPLSLLLVKPIYISSLVILRYKTVATLHDNYIEKHLQAFWEKLSAVPGLSTGGYYFCKPDVFVVDMHPKVLFPTCFTPYIQEKHSEPSCGGKLPQQESTIKQKTNPACSEKIGGALPDVIGDAGIETLVFSINDGIGSKAERDKIIKLKGRLFQPTPELKQQRLKSLQEARTRLSKAINVSEALKIQNEQISEQMKIDFEKRCNIIDDTISMLKSFKMYKTDIDELAAQEDESKGLLGRIIKETNLKIMQTTISSNLENEKMHQDLQKLKEKEDTNTHTLLMGCDWARYIETMQSDL